MLTIKIIRECCEFSRQSVNGGTMVKNNTEVSSEEAVLEVQREKYKSRVSTLTTEQKMLDVSLWTNRLDRRLKLRLADFKLRLSQHIATLKSLDKRLPEDLPVGSLIKTLIEQTEQAYAKLLPEITELSVVAADHVYLLDSMTHDYKERYKEIEARLWHAEAKVAELEHELDLIRQSKSFRLGHYILAPMRLLKESCTAVEPKRLPAPEKISHINQDLGIADTNMVKGSRPELKIDVTDFDAYNPHSSVNNENTGFKAFNDWATFYRHEGKAYGCSNKPSVSDHLDHIIELHEAFSFKDKTVLELGPFEAGNTKQMLDLGAKKVVGIEANRDFFLKCCLVKNEFKLNRAEFVYGNCLEILDHQLGLADAPRYDICVASGILYHFENPLIAIDLITRCSPIIYVWTQYASEDQPTGEWLEITDDDGRSYRGRSNTYSQEQHWGGVAPHAVWLADPDIKTAFELRGFEILNPQYGESHKGKFISFIAEQK